MKLKFYGASDDLFECEIEDEGNPTRQPDQEISGEGRVLAFLIMPPDPSKRMIVAGIYSPSPIDGGTWVVGVTQADDETPIPNWPMSFSNAPISGTNTAPYSPMLTIEAPEGCVVLEFGGDIEDHDE